MVEHSDHSYVRPVIGVVVDKSQPKLRYFALHEPTRRLCCEEGHSYRYAAVSHGEEHLLREVWALA